MTKDEILAKIAQNEAQIKEIFQNSCNECMILNEKITLLSKENEELFALLNVMEEKK